MSAVLKHCYGKGLGVGPDRNESIRWYKSAAENGDAEAEYFIGSCYLKGYASDYRTNIIQQDLIESYKWFLLAQRNGIEKAGANLRRIEKHLSTSEKSEAERRAKALPPSNQRGAAR